MTGAIPFTASGLGAYEIVAQQLLSTEGVPAPTGAAVAVAAHAVSLIATLLGGLISVIALRVRPGEIFWTRAEAAGDDSDVAPRNPPTGMS